MCKTLKIIIITVLKIFFSTLIIASQSNAQGRDKTYERIKNTSAKIVRGKIIGREEVRYDYDGVDMRCGYILEIDVIKTFKGGNDNFKVFASNSDILMNDAPDTEYFMFVRENPAFGERPAIDFINCDEGRSTRMDISGFEYLSTRFIQQIFPIVSYTAENPIVDEDTGVVKKDEWMMIVDRIANNALPYTISRRRLNNGNLAVIEEMSLRNFLDEFDLNG
jgi:hypothetical protein